MFTPKEEKSMENDHLLIRPRGEDGYKVFSVRVKEQTLQGIEEVAARTGRSRNELIGMMLEYALPRIKIES
jgi:predicted HicB family RNase H-like nuclease